MRYYIVIPILLFVASAAVAENHESAETAVPVDAVVAEGEAEVEEESHEVQNNAAAKELGLTPEVISKLDGEQIEALLKERELTRREKVVARSNNMGPEIVAPVAFFLAMIIIVFLPLFFHWRRQQALHGTLAAMVEKGVEIPIELIAPKKPKRNDLRTGIVLVSAGLGVSIFLALLPEVAEGVWAAGLIPLLIGVGYLIAWRLQPKEDEAHSPRGE